MISIGFLYWLILILWFLFGAWSFRVPEGRYNWVGFGGSFILILLLALIGWKLFGKPISP